MTPGIETGLGGAVAGTDSRAVQLAQEQAALRRVATLVASSAEPEQVFQTVAEEAGRLLAARTAATVRFDQPDAVVVSPELRRSASTTGSRKPSATSSPRASRTR